MLHGVLSIEGIVCGFEPGKPFVFKTIDILANKKKVTKHCWMLQ
jgi:hypothetical protein